jgi:flagellar motility protein MotE (MotC chaperone)
MKINFFSPLLVVLILTLAVKASMLFGKIQEQTTNTTDASVTSVFVDTAYAKNKSDKAQTTEQPRSKESKQTQSEPVSTNPTVSSSNEEKLNNAGNVAHTQPPKNALPSMSNSELQLLKELSQRRQELDKIQKNIAVRDQVLKATESKIDQKMVALRSLQAQVEEIMKQYNEKEQGKIMSLVKIYESMKPRDAAKIFDELEIPVLLEVVSRMKEIRVAPVIANMNPQRARELSIELAKQKTIN